MHQVDWNASCHFARQSISSICWIEHQEDPSNTGELQLWPHLSSRFFHVVVQGNTMPGRYMQDAREGARAMKLFLTATRSNSAEENAQLRRYDI